MKVKSISKNSDTAIIEPDDAEDGPFTSCNWCGKGISDGDAFVEVSRNVEFAENNGGLMNVISSEEVLCLCEDCGSRVSIASMRQVLDGLRRE